MSDQDQVLQKSETNGVVLSAIIINPDAIQVSRSELPGN